MNILFILKSLETGGVEVVTATLANKFKEEGHNVFLFSFSKGNNTIASQITKVQVYIGDGFRITGKNVELVRQILVNEKIDIIINQWGLPLVPIKVINKARKGLGVKVISVFHNDPLQNGRVQNVALRIAGTKNLAKKLILHIQKMLYRSITGYSMRYIYQQSNLFEVLSPSYVSHFQEFTWLNSTLRLAVQTNPITIDVSEFVYSPEKKRNEIIYVGRIDYTQKRVCRIIDIWALLKDKFQDWHLTIVGDGEERGNIERQVENLKLERVNFEGFQQPRSYYERASILMLTSEFEGFPLVLAECMSFGVVPVVYGSYSAVYDIIDDGKDGVIIEKTVEGFNPTVMAERMSNLMTDRKRLNEMALAAIEKSKNYSVDIIYEQWMAVLKDLVD